MKTMESANRNWFSSVPTYNKIFTRVPKDRDLLRTKVSHGNPQILVGTICFSGFASVEKSSFKLTLQLEEGGRGIESPSHLDIVTKRFQARFSDVISNG